MIKTVFSSFFRTIGRIIAYLAFGALLALLFKNSDVFAVDYGHDYYTNSANYGSYNCSGLDCSITQDVTTFTQGSDIVNLGFNNPRDYVYRLRIRVYGNSSYIYEQDNTYTLRFTINLYMVQDGYTNLTNDEVLQMLETNYKVKMYGNTTASSTGSNTDYIDNFSYYWKHGTVDGRYLLYVTFTTTDDLKFLSVFLNDKDYINGKDPNYTHNFFGSYNVSYLKVTYTEGMNSALDNQTIVIQNEFNDVKDKITDFIDIFQQNADKTEDIYLNDTENEDGTCGGILCNLKKVVKGVINFPQTILTAIVDGLKALFIPSDFSFLDDFRNSIENKLGFIAEVPMAIIDFTLNLATASWDEFDSISFPSISIFGYNFWNAQEIDLSEAIRIFAPFKYITDCLCVILCARTLNRWREKFTGGGD